jgi:RNA polymerase I-specific transcription initiation factor RRN7
LVIVSTKLLFGLDGISRAPRSAAEPAAIGLKWEAWDEYLRTGNAELRGLLGGSGKAGGKELEVDVGEKDVFEMSGEELDKYMDWFERNWADDSNTNRMSVPSHDLSPGLVGWLT